MVAVSGKKKNENKDTYSTDSVITEEIAKLEKKFDGSGRILIRPSGTEPLIRVMIEGENYDEIKKDAEYLAEVIRKRLL